ncbi:hypothetical protein BaRGS_00002128 [Batillaria attramentaria]|uniref:Uncharacterized protein n=1 Tax=Batillaria attramentaria TaxID=370345 RepID=A0ABD0M5D1_9CAEN
MRKVINVTMSRKTAKTSLSVVIAFWRQKIGRVRMTVQQHSKTSIPLLIRQCIKLRYPLSHDSAPLTLRLPVSQPATRHISPGW